MKTQRKLLCLLISLFLLLIALNGCGGSESGGESGDEDDSHDDAESGTYYVTYDGNGNSGGAVPADATAYEEGQIVTVLGNTGGLVNENIVATIFTGWNTATDGSGTTYTEGETFTIGSADVTLYAKWFPTEEDALAALSVGTKIFDGTSDYVGLHGIPNPEAYYLDFADLTEADFGVDSYYLYTKYTFVGTWPVSDDDWPNVDGDQVYDFGCTAFFDTDNDSQTGIIDDSGAEIMTEIGYRMDEPYFHTIKVDPNPDNEPGDPEEGRYLTSYDSNYSFVFGGSGYNYVIVAYPLLYVGLSPGQDVTEITKCEGTSENWNDVSYDPLGITGNYDERRIPITLGQNETISYY